MNILTYGLANYHSVIIYEPKSLVLNGFSRPSGSPLAFCLEFRNGLVSPYERPTRFSYEKRNRG